MKFKILKIAITAVLLIGATFLSFTVGEFLLSQISADYREWKKEQTWESRIGHFKSSKNQIDYVSIGTYSLYKDSLNLYYVKDGNAEPHWSGFNQTWIDNNYALIDNDEKVHLGFHAGGGYSGYSLEIRIVNDRFSVRLTESSCLHTLEFDIHNPSLRIEENTPKIGKQIIGEFFCEARYPDAKPSDEKIIIRGVFEMEYRE